VTIRSAARKIPHSYSWRDHWVERRNSPDVVEKPVRAVWQKQVICSSAEFDKKV